MGFFYFSTYQLGYRGLTPKTNQKISLELVYVWLNT